MSNDLPAVVVTLYGGTNTRVYLADGSGTELTEVRMIDLDSDDLAGMDENDLSDWADLAAEWNLPEVAKAIKEEITERLEYARHQLDVLTSSLTVVEAGAIAAAARRKTEIERDIANVKAAIERLEGEPL